jgi:PAS domain S-box-containing protein
MRSPPPQTSALDTAVVVSDPHGLIRRWEGAAEHLLGFEAGEIVGRSVEVLIAPKCRPRHRVGYERAIATGRLENAHTGIVPMVHKDGRIVRMAFDTRIIEVDGIRHVSVVLAHAQRRPTRQGSQS